MQLVICAIHQPQYLPWLGYFDKIAASDVFVFLNDTQFKKNEWQNRNKIKTATGWQWLTVPVVHEFGQEIRHTKIDNRAPWRRKHLQALVSNYSKSPYFKEHRTSLESLYGEEWESLADVNIGLVEFFMAQLGITAKTVLSTELGVEGKATEALIQICKRVGADTYLSGAGGKDYLEEERFEQEGITLVYQDYRHPTYPQLYGEFVSHLSIVDLIFNCGPQSLEVLRGPTEEGS